MLAEPDALLAAWLVSRAAHAMLRFDLLPFKAVIVIVMDISMLGQRR